MIIQECSEVEIECLLSYIYTKGKSSPAHSTSPLTHLHL